MNNIHKGVMRLHFDVLVLCNCCTTLYNYYGNLALVIIQVVMYNPNDHTKYLNLCLSTITSSERQQ